MRERRKNVEKTKRRKDYRLKHFKSTKQLVEHATKVTLARSIIREEVAKVAKEEMGKMRMKAFFKRKLDEGLSFKG